MMGNTSFRTPVDAQLRTVLQVIVPIFKKHKLRLGLGFLGLLGVDFLQLIIPRFIKSGIDGLSQNLATTASLARLSLYILSAAVFVVAFRFLWRYMIIGFSRILEKSLRNRLFEHVLKMDQPFFERWTTGDLMAHASNDLAAVQMACGMGMVAAVDAFVMSSAAVGFMIHINLKLTLLALLPMPLLALCTRVLSGRLHHRFNLVQEQFSLMTEFARSTMVSIKLIKGYTLEQFQGKQFERLGKKYVHSNLRVAVIQGLLFPVATLVGNTGMLLVVYFGGILVIEETITLGDFVAFITYLYMLVWPMMAVGWVTSLAQRGATSLRRIHRLLAEQPRVQRYPVNAVEVSLPTAFQCRKLSFTYPSASSPALTSITLEIPPGVLGITGRTGSGKSTLCKLFLRLYPVEDNCLFLNNRDVNQINLDALRSNIAYVAQESLLFSETIKKNITYGKPDASVAEIHEAARAAAIHDDIMGFPDQYQSVIGERGVKLSGGQRQRVALARALLCKRSMLIIDDALSAIDVETEQQLMNNIKKVFISKTVILISHRVNVLRTADSIVVLENGSIIAQGKHEDLLHTSLYEAMVEKQLADA